MLKGKGIIQKFFLCMFACVLFVFGGAGVAWATSDVCTITLNPNNGTGAKQGGDSSSSTNDTKTIYSQYGDGAYKTNTNDVLSNQMTSQSGLGDTPPSPVLGIPVGRNVTWTFDAQTSAPIDPITGNQYSVTNPSDLVKQRSFVGYYSTTNGTTSAPMVWLSQNADKQCIDADGYITSYGQGLAESIAQNSGSCPATAWYAQYDCKNSGDLPSVTVLGHTVTRWKDGGTNLPTVGGTSMCTDHNFVARWQANTYTITYAPGLIGGNSVSKSVNFDANVYTDNTALAAITNPFTVPTGYIFTGWSSNYNVGTGTPTTNPMTSYDEGDSLGYYKVVGSTTMTAQWDCDTGYTWVNGECVKIYTVAYNANGHGTYTGGYTAETNVFGPGLPDGGQYGSTWTTKGLGASASHIEPATECDNFCGWSLNPNDTCGSQSIIASGTTVGIWNYNDNITLYAIWGCAPGCANNNGVCVPIVTHNVTYNQGNCIIPKGAYLEYNRPEGSYNLADAATAQISPDGNASCCHFDGWSTTDPSSNSSVTILNSPINLTSDMTLYGVCSCDTVNIIYHGCDGVATSSDTTGVGSFSVLSYSATGMSETGYTFTNKWSTTTDENGDIYPVGSTFVVSSCDPSGTTVNLYALCSQDGYTITLEQQGADTSSVPTTLYTTASVGAYLESSRTNLMSTSANNITIPSKTAHTTSYNANAPQNTSVTAPGNSVATWTFNGFYESTADNSAQYIDDTGYITGDGDTIAKNLSANDTWYAKWTANCVDVQSAPTAPTGYSFGGWYKNAAGTGDAVTQICADDDFDTLYAKWGPLVVSVTYWCLNESPGAFAYYDTEFVMQNYGGNCQPGRTFLGWKCDHDFATGEGTHGVYNYDYPLENGVITGGTVVSKATEDVWCESQWTKRVLYSCGNGTGNAPTDSNQYVAGDSVTVLDNGAGNCVPPEGYLFGRWKCNNGVGNKVATNTFSYPDVDSDVTCTAMYDFNTVFLEWNPNGGQPSSIDTPESCFYGEDNGISGIAHPTKTGYTFNGWRLTYWQCYIPEIDTSKSGSSRGYINNNGGTYFSAEEFGLTQLGTFAVRFSYGQVNGRSKCSSLSTGDNPGDDDGDYCWCKVTGVIPTDGEQCDVDYFPWLFYGHTGGSCTSNCADFCAQALRNNWDNARVYMLTRPQ